MKSPARNTIRKILWSVPMNTMNLCLAESFTSLQLHYKSIYYFVLDLLETAGFSEHFHAYRVSSTRSEVDVCVQADLVDYHPLTESKTFYPTTSQSFVRLKYHVFL